MIRVHVIKIKDGYREFNQNYIEEFQNMLFEMGKSWPCGDKYKEYIYEDNIIIIDNHIYTMSNTNIDRFRKQYDIKLIIYDDYKVFIRMCKLKKLKGEEI